MTGTNALFPRSSFVGFDHLLAELDQVTRHANDSYPPHNVLRQSDSDYLIELAVAGFVESELNVEVKDRTLTIVGEHTSQNREYIHRGISTKKFKRTFRLSEHVQVYGANLKDGILSVQLKYVVPLDRLPRKILIQKNEETKNETSPQFLSED